MVPFSRSTSNKLKRNQYTLSHWCGITLFPIATLWPVVGYFFRLFFHQQIIGIRSKKVFNAFIVLFEGYKFAFDKMKVSNWDAKGTKYDLDSIMHYGQRWVSFSPLSYFYFTECYSLQEIKIAWVLFFEKYLICCIIFNEKRTLRCCFNEKNRYLVGPLYAGVV